MVRVLYRLKAFDVEVSKEVTYRDEQEADPNRHKLNLYQLKGQMDFLVMLLINGGR